MDFKAEEAGVQMYGNDDNAERRHIGQFQACSDASRLVNGQALFDMAVKWSRGQGLVQISIECQNNNVPAVRFYHKQGAVLSAINEYAGYKNYVEYKNDQANHRHEVQFIWYLDLQENIND